MTENDATARNYGGDIHQQPEPEQQQQPENQNDKTKQGIILIFVSTFLFSLMGMYLQLASSHGIPSTEIAFARSAFQGAFIMIGMFVFRIDDSPTDNSSEGEDEKRKDDNDDEPASGIYCNSMNDEMQTSLPPRIIQHPFGTNKLISKVVVFRGLFGGFAFMFKFYTLSALPLGDATALLSLYPIITIFLAHFLLGETMRPLQIVAAISSVVGAALIARPRFLFGDNDEGNGDEHPPAIGYVTALLGSIFASAVIVLIRKAGRVGAHTLQLLFSWMVFGLTLSLAGGAIAAKSSSGGQQWLMPSREAMPSLLGTCVSGGMAHFLLNYAGKFVPATMSGLIRSSGILWAYLFEMLVFGQLPRKETWLGVFFVFSSLMLVLISSKVQDRAKHVFSAELPESNNTNMKHLPSFGTLIRYDELGSTRMEINKPFSTSRMQHFELTNVICER